MESCTLWYIIEIFKDQHFNTINMFLGQAVADWRHFYSFTVVIYLNNNYLAIVSPGFVAYLWQAGLGGHDCIVSKQKLK